MAQLKKIFISYSKHDMEFKETLIKHLSGLRGSVVTWNDRNLLPGEEWDERIKAELREADIVLYLVSANSLATDYIQNVELPIIEERHQRGECVFVPIIVDFCYWEKQNFAKYNALPDKGYPITDEEHWSNQNKAWLKVIEGIEKVTHQELKAKTSDSSLPKQNYLRHYADDVVIHAAEKDLAFAEDFKTQLQKHLAAKLGGYIFS
jgi:hypothetical protein